MGYRKQKKHKFSTQNRSLPRTLQEFENLIEDKESKKLISKEVFSAGSSCPRVIEKKTNCKPNASTMMKSVMCHTWYSPGNATSDELLVTTFRRNIREAWNQYHSVCQR